MAMPCPRFTVMGMQIALDVEGDRRRAVFTPAAVHTLPVHAPCHAAALRAAIATAAAPEDSAHLLDALEEGLARFALRREGTEELPADPKMARARAAALACQNVLPPLLFADMWESARA